MIYLLYQKPWPVGGSLTYVSHLTRCFDMAGIDYTVLRLTDRAEAKPRRVGEHEFRYRNADLSQIKALRGPVLLTMGDPELEPWVWMELAQMPNLWTTFHDPGEFSFEHWKHLDRRRVICVRETGLLHMPDAKVILHPYVRRYSAFPEYPRKTACTVSRINGPKNSKLMIEANANLPEDARIDMRGAWARFWWWANISKTYGQYAEWTDDMKGFPRGNGKAAEVCSEYKLMVDMSDICCQHWGQGKRHRHDVFYFSEDGQGTQYTTLEAMDGGAVPVVSSQWFMAGRNNPPLYECFHAANAIQLENICRMVATGKADGDLWIKARKNEEYLREHHDPIKIARQYEEVLSYGK